MGKRQQFELSVQERRRRKFSYEFKKRKVKEIESGQVRLCDLHREYAVSYTSIYRWINKFGVNKEKRERLIVESKSDTVKLLELQKKIVELERIVGQKQILLDFKSKMIELAEEHYKIDIKKKFLNKPSGISGKTEKK